MLFSFLTSLLYICMIEFNFKLTISLNKFEVYQRMSNRVASNHESKNLIISYSTINNKIDCLQQCNKYSNCTMAMVYSAGCFIYDRIDYKSLSSLNIDSTFLFKRHFYFVLHTTMIYYWPFDHFYSEKIENIGIVKTINSSFTLDRFNRTNSSINFYSGFYQVSNLYFGNSDFTISVWARFEKLPKHQRICEFADDSTLNNIGFAVASNKSLACWVRKGFSYLPICETSKKLVEGVWYHVACILRGNQINVYIDGVLYAHCTSYVPNLLVRNTNYIGRSFYATDPLFYGAIDDLQIYNKSLTDNELTEIINKSY